MAQPLTLDEIGVSDTEAAQCIYDLRCEIAGIRRVLVDRLCSRIADEIEPKLDRPPGEGGYDCCGCSTYDRIVDDVVALIRSEVDDE